MSLIRLASRSLLPFLLLLASTVAVAAEKKPVYVGLDAELAYAGSTSAQAIRMGMLSDRVADFEFRVRECLGGANGMAHRPGAFVEIGNPC